MSDNKNTSALVITVTDGGKLMIVYKQFVYVSIVCTLIGQTRCDVTVGFLK